MIFGHDTVTALGSAVALVNSVGPPDTLTSVAAVDAFWRTWGYTGRHDRDAAELAAIRALRGSLRTLLLADRAAAAALVNAFLAEAGAVPRLVRHDDQDWHIHAVPDDAPLATRVQVETAMAMVEVVRHDEHTRLSTCADDGCEGLVLDLSRNRSRRYCSTTCGNRNAVAAYRARRG